MSDTSDTNDWKPVTSRVRNYHFPWTVNRRVRFQIYGSGHDKKSFREWGKARDEVWKQIHGVSES